MGNDSRKSQADIDWENRILCSDGNCIGVIGPNGECKECGLPYEGTWPITGMGNAAPEETAASEPQAPYAKEPENEQPEDDTASTDDDEWENRRLCIDGNCIGVIGPDGKCKECGLPYEA